MISTAAFHARVRGSVPGLGGLKETKMFLPHPRVKVSIVGSLHDREVACSASLLRWVTLVRNSFCPMYWRSLLMFVLSSSLYGLIVFVIISYWCSLSISDVRFV